MTRLERIFKESDVVIGRKWSVFDLGRLARAMRWERTTNPFTGFPEIPIAVHDMNEWYRGWDAENSIEEDEDVVIGIKYKEFW